MRQASLIISIAIFCGLCFQQETHGFSSGFQNPPSGAAVTHLGETDSAKETQNGSTTRGNGGRVTSTGSNANGTGSNSTQNTPPNKDTPKSGDSKAKTERLAYVLVLPFYCAPVFELDDLAAAGNADLAAETRNYAAQDTCEKQQEKQQQQNKKVETATRVKIRARMSADLLQSLSDDFQHLVMLGSDAVAVRTTGEQKQQKPGEPREKNALGYLEDLLPPAFAEVVHVRQGSAERVATVLNEKGLEGLEFYPVSPEYLEVWSTSPISSYLQTELGYQIQTALWSGESVSPATRVFNLEAADLAKTLSPGPESTKPTAKPETESVSTTSPKAKGDSKTKSKKTSDQNGKTGTVQPKKADKETDNSEDSEPTTQSKSADDKAAPKPISSGTSAAIAPTKPAVAVAAVNDTLLLSNPDGTDKGLAEKNRLIAVLDLPRPEVLLNVWSTQSTSSDPRYIKKQADDIRQTVSEFNDRLQNSLDYGWSYLSNQMKREDKNCSWDKTAAKDKGCLFDRAFVEYVTRRFVKDFPDSYWSDQTPTLLSDAERARLGICRAGMYCLGYSELLDPLKPTLTNLLIAMIASNRPVLTMMATIGCMSGPTFAPDDCFSNRESFRVAVKDGREDMEKLINSDHPTPGLSKMLQKTEDLWKAEDNAKKAANNQIVKSLQKEMFPISKNVFDCETEDRLELWQAFAAHEQEYVQLSCFEAQAVKSLLSIDDFSTFDSRSMHYLSYLKLDDHPKDILPDDNALTLYDNHFDITRVGMLRGALANFLFNYKMSQEYPHNFDAYELSTSAQELNSELNPLIVAFNRDVSAFAQYLQSKLAYKYPPRKSFLRDRDDFENDGIVTVRGISGVDSLVDTLTQNFFDATKPPTVTELLSSVTDSEKKVPTLLKANLTADEAALIVGALNSVKSTTAKIGRELTVDITPHALAGASSAELDVKLDAQESAAPTLFSNDKSSEDDISRVANHKTSTKVRVDSLKLFEVSSFSAMVQRPKSRFPLIPPFFEVPFIGSFIGVPIPGAREYHRSTAIVSAVIVPTAADIAYGIDFRADRTCERDLRSKAPSWQPLTCRKQQSFADFMQLPIKSYNRARIECFVSNGARAFVSEIPSPSPEFCQNLTFSSVPPNQ